MEEKESLISAATAAKRLNISRSTLSRLAKSGRLAVYRVGHRMLFDEKILEEFKASVLTPAQQGLKNSSGNN
jgi:excisionase family DNA binding protein